MPDSKGTCRQNRLSIAFLTRNFSLYSEKFGRENAHVKAFFAYFLTLRSESKCPCGMSTKVNMIEEVKAEENRLTVGRRTPLSADADISPFRGEPVIINLMKYFSPLKGEMSRSDRGVSR